MNDTPILGTLSSIDLIALGINFLLFIFTRQIVTVFRSDRDSASVSTKIWTLRLINIVLFGIYFLELFVGGWTSQLSRTGLTLLIAYLIVNFLHIVIIRKYGRLKEIDGSEYRVETYQSEIFNLLIIIAAFIIVLIAVINIWGVTDWFKTTSVLGGLLIVLFSTKDYWAPDNINGLMLLYNGDIEPGSIIKIDEYDLVAVTIETTLTQTRFRDLRSKHVVVMPNSKLRNAKVEVLNKCPAVGLMQSVDFKISYGLPAKDIETFLNDVWIQACESEKSLNPEKQAKILILENGDHAVVWRLAYWVKNIYGLYDAEFAVNRAAYELSLESGIALNTPLTHELS
ncbi:MAG: hypothetical protein AB8D52_00790 [Gammaproteobacteria bacterium]